METVTPIIEPNAADYLDKLPPAGRNSLQHSPSSCLGLPLRVISGDLLEEGILWTLRSLELLIPASIVLGIRHVLPTAEVVQHAGTPLHASFGDSAAALSGRSVGEQAVFVLFLVGRGLVLKHDFR